MYFALASGFKQLLVLTSIVVGCIVAAEPVQYCKYGSRGEINFCMGLTVHRNITSKTEDIYLSFIHSRYDGSDRGWTAIGTGNEMLGSLMFIVYGDPLAGEDPIVSIRGSTGHVQPQLIQRDSSGGLDLRVLRSQWIPTSSQLQGFTPDQPIYEARVSLVCYSCALWSGSKLDLLSSSQPWIWAWNEEQEFSSFTYDAHLLMHKHHAGAGGWGIFYLDMARALSEASGFPSLPPIRSNVAMVGASESPLGTGRISVLVGLLTRPELHLHGILGGIAFLIFFPAGVLSINSGSKMAFRYHWVFQVLASILTLNVCLAGLYLRHRISTYHQIQGLLILSILPLQTLAGWMHHVKYLKIGRRTWISHTHTWLGRSLMVAGAINLITGTVLRGYGRTVPISAGVLCIVVYISLAIFTYRRSVRRDRLNKMVTSAAAEEISRSYFSVAASDSDEEDDGEAEEQEKSATGTP